MRTQRVLRASGTRLAPTEPEARPQVQILSHRLIKRGIIRKSGSFFLCALLAKKKSPYFRIRGLIRSFTDYTFCTECSRQKRQHAITVAMIRITIPK